MYLWMMWLTLWNLVCDCSTNRRTNCMHRFVSMFRGIRQCLMFFFYVMMIFTFCWIFVIRLDGEIYLLSFWISSERNCRWKFSGALYMIPCFIHISQGWWSHWFSFVNRHPLLSPSFVKVYAGNLIFAWHRNTGPEGWRIRQRHFETVTSLVRSCRRFFPPGSANEIWTEFTWVCKFLTSCFLFIMHH